MSTDRPAFKPNRARASLTAVPSSSTTSSSLFPNKENGLSTSPLIASTSTQSGASRKKRAQSLGGDALEGLRKRTKLEELRAEATMTIELSPSRADRRKAAPRRSILKQVGAIFENNTVNFGSSRRASLAFDPTSATTDLSTLSTFQSKSARRRSSIKPVENPVEQYDDSDEDDEDPNGSLDMEITKMDITVAFDREGKRVHRASHSRRVSFAPSANVRHYTPDKPTAEAQNAQAARERVEAAALEYAANTGDDSFVSQTSGQESESSDEEEDDDGIESEPSMEIAGDEVTLAFKGHFAGTQLPISALLPTAEEEDGNHSSEEEDEGERDENGTQAMDEVTSDLTNQHTGGFDAQAVNSRAQAEEQQRQAASTLQQEQSKAPVQPKPPTNRPRFSTVARQEDDEDEQIMRSLGFAKGGKPRKSRVGLARVGEEDEEEEEEEGSDMEDEDGTAAMEMTTAVGGIVSQQPSSQPEDSDDEADSAEVSMQLIGGTGINSNEVTMDLDQTMDMEEATANYGSILSRPLPRPSLAPRLASPIRSRTASPSRSAAPPSSRTVQSSRAGSVPLGDNALLGTPSKSPFRRSGGYGTPQPRQPSPLPSPRRVSAPRPAPPPPAAQPQPPKSPARARSRSASPVKQTPFLPPSSLAAKSPSSLAAKSPRKTPAVSQAARDPLRSSISPVKSASTALASVTRPRQSIAAGRSPGGSLSLKGLLAQQQTASQSSPNKLEEVVGEKDLNLTGSEFENSFDANPDAPQPLASIEEFFAATGTEFVNDIIGMTGGFDLSSSKARRKSLAASAFGDESKDRTPPTFADLVVTSACHSVMYELYRNDQKLLLGRMQEVREAYDELEAYVESGEVPAVFRNWSAASDEEKLHMKNQFAQIKLFHLVQGQVEWKGTRNQNLDQIITAMQQSLEELQQDRPDLAQFEISSVIPSLQERHAALDAELMAERALDEELSSYNEDQREELAQLHADIEEQEEQINGNRSKGIPGARPQFERIEQQLQKDRNVLETEKEKELAATERIAELEAALKDKRTKSDLSRMKAEFEALQQLHGWSLVRFTSTIIQLRHFDELDVAFELDCNSLKVINTEFRLVETKQWSSTLALDITNFLVGRIAERIGEEIQSGHQDPRSLLQSMSTKSLVLRHVRHEVSLASLDYPIHFDPTSQSLELEIYSAKAKKAFLVSVPMNEIELDVGYDKTRWAEHLSAEIQIKFGGNIGSAGLAINERLNDCEGLLAALRAGESAISV